MLNALTDPLAASIATRIAGCMQAGSFEMETFLSLHDIRLTDSPQMSAAIEGGTDPVLWLNPRFIEKYCKRDEQLLMLVMHEMLHVSLCHLSVFPSMTLDENIACDAIINAMLCHEALKMRNSKDCLDFFRELNPPNLFPAMLLAPPIGWPSWDSGYMPKGTRLALRRVMGALYGDGSNPTPGPKILKEPTYQAIMDLLGQVRSTPKLSGIPRGGFDQVTVIGSHRPCGDVGKAPEITDSRYTDGTVKRVLEATLKWKPTHEMQYVSGAGNGGEAIDKRVVTGLSSHLQHRVMGDLFRKVIGTPRLSRRKSRPEPTRAHAPFISTTGVLPDARDRTRWARIQLGGSPLLWRNAVPLPFLKEDQSTTVPIYLDVSGSMSLELPVLFNLLLPYVQSGQVQLFQFSTQVYPLSLKKLANGRVRSTGGTNIQCVGNHLVTHEEFRSAIIVSDGEFQRIWYEDLATLRRRGVALHVALTAKGTPRSDDLAPFTSITNIPTK